MYNLVMFWNDSHVSVVSIVSVNELKVSWVMLYSNGIDWRK